MRRSLLYVCCLVGLVTGGVGWRYGAEILSLGAVTSGETAPEQGGVVGGVYRNAYFDLSYPLPDGWTEGVAGPEPSATGYYVLETLVPKGELTASIMIAAQDMFFAEAWTATPAMVASFRQAMAQIDGMTIDSEPEAVNVAGRTMHRIDYSGVGLHRSLYVTEIRCHLVSFTLTARDHETLASLRPTLDRLATAANRRAEAPPCVDDYVVAENLLERVEPELSRSTFESIPVRLVIGADGGVKQVRVIRATPGQRNALEQALHRWKIKPPRLDGRPSEIEAGWMFRPTVAAK